MTLPGQNRDAVTGEASSLRPVCRLFAGAEVTVNATPTPRVAVPDETSRQSAGNEPALLRAAAAAGTVRTVAPRIKQM